jgi:hypothetical protein
LTQSSRGNKILKLDEFEQLIETSLLLVARLERLSADSIWAHRASGVRGALLRSIESLGKPGAQDNFSAAGELLRLKNNITSGFTILEKAAQELIQ